jgi:phage shock protein C
MHMDAKPIRKVFRSRNERMIAGVSGGIAEYAGIDPNIIRLAFVLLAFAGGGGVLAYLVAWMIIPERPV